MLHVRSIYSSEIFPIGWCNKHKYILSFPKSPYIDCSDYVNCYYTSDIDVDFNESDDKNAIKYPRFFKGDVHYHYKKKYNFFLLIYLYLVFTISKNYFILVFLQILKIIQKIIQ